MSCYIHSRALYEPPLTCSARSQGGGARRSHRGAREAEGVRAGAGARKEGCHETLQGAGELTNPHRPTTSSSHSAPSLSQADSFDSERQSWYDQEQHYKLRISNLTSNNRKTPRGSLASDLTKPAASTKAESDVSEAENDDEPRPARSTSPATPSFRSSTASPTPSASAGPTPAELALQDQLVSLTTAHDSLSSTLRTLQTEMSDLKRVYQDLQEENESYEILLGEKTLNGEVRGSELFRQSFHWGESGEDGPAQGLGFLGGLEAVGEGDEDDFSDLEGEDDYDTGEEDDVDRILLESRGVGSPNSGAVAAGTSSRRNSRQTKKKRPSGGLDLAAELEAAQMEDSEAEEIKRKKQAKLERRRASQARRQSAAQGMGERRGSIMPGSIEGKLISSSRRHVKKRVC